MPVMLGLLSYLIPAALVAYMHYDTVIWDSGKPVRPLASAIVGATWPVMAAFVALVIAVELYDLVRGWLREP